MRPTMEECYATFIESQWHPNIHFTINLLQKHTCKRLYIWQHGHIVAPIPELCPHVLPRALYAYEAAQLSKISSNLYCDE